MNKEQEIIKFFTDNLNQKEKINELVVIGREEEIKQMIYVLSRLIKNNPLLIGYPGVGKTAIVEGLVQKIKRGEVPDYLKNKIIYQLNMMSLLAGTKFQGELEERLKVIFYFMSRPENNAILFIDEIHLIVGAGRSQGALDISNLLKPLLSRGEIQCIGATTQEEYRQYIEKDGALVRRFSNIKICEPNTKESLKILHGIKNHLEIYYELKIQDDALEAAVHMSQRYLTASYLPDKAIDLLDETCGRMRSEMWYEPEAIIQTKKKLQELEIRQTLLSQGENGGLLDLQQEIVSQKKKLQELEQQDQKESGIIQKLNNYKKKLAQTKKELVNYQQMAVDYNRAGEIKYYLIPQLEKEINNLEQEA